MSTTDTRDTVERCRDMARDYARAWRGIEGYLRDDDAGGFAAMLRGDGIEPECADDVYAMLGDVLQGGLDIYLTGRTLRGEWVAREVRVLLAWGGPGVELALDEHGAGVVSVSWYCDAQTYGVNLPCVAAYLWELCEVSA